MKGIKKMLSEQAKDVLPDPQVKEKVRNELGLDAKAEALAYAHGGTGEESKRRRRAALPLAAAALALVLTLCILLPIFLNRSAPGVHLGNKFDAITDADSFYAYGAASVGSLLAAGTPTDTGTQSAGTADRAARAKAAFEVSARQPSDAQMQTIGRYMALVENLLGQGNIAEEAIAGNGEYQFGMQVSYADLLGETVSYTLYYDKIFRGGETDGDEREENYSIRGVLIVESASYPVEGTYETESEQGEEESEMTFTAYTGENSYIRASQATESETEGDESEQEREYVYAVYENGRLVERTTVEYESEEGELELLLTVQKDGETERLLFTDEEEGGERVLRVRGNIGGEAVRFTVYIRHGQYHYVFEDGSSYDGDRYDDDDDDDGDDDDDDD